MRTTRYSDEADSQVSSETEALGEALKRRLKSRRENCKILSAPPRIYTSSTGGDIQRQFIRHIMCFSSADSREPGSNNVRDDLLLSPSFSCTTNKRHWYMTIQGVQPTYFLTYRKKGV